MRLTARRLNRATLGRQLLLRREPLGAAEGVRRVVALQAQEAVSPYIALWSRVAGDVVDLVSLVQAGTSDPQKTKAATGREASGADMPEASLMIEKDKTTLHPCSTCGQPTTADVCTYCKMLARVKASSTH